MLNIKKTEKKPQLTDRYGGTSQTYIPIINELWFCIAKLMFYTL